MFGLGTQGGQAADVRVGFRTGWLRYVNVAFGGVGLAAILLVIVRILASDPKQAFGLLESWGPNFFIALLVVMILGAQMDRMVEIQRDGAQAQRQMAEAMSAIAAKDDRQVQEIQTLTAYTAQQSEHIRRQHANTERVLRLIAKRLKITPEEIALEEHHG